MKNPLILLATEDIKDEPKYTKRSSRWGNVRSKTGALYTFGDEAGFEMAARDILEVSLEKQGIPINEDTREIVEYYARQKRIELFQKAKNRKIPDYFYELFSACDKKSAENICSSITITKQDLAALVAGSKRLGYSHRIKRKDFLPEQLKVTDVDRLAMKDIQPGVLDRRQSSAFRKMIASFDQRKVHICHLFQRKQIWHCIYFSFNDVANGTNNHWKFGTHVHYVSSRWNILKPHQLLKLFEYREVKIAGDFHVRCELNDDVSEEVK